MNSAFMEAAISLNNDYVREWKEAGKKVVGYTCSYVPDELLYAAGILPYRVRGFGATEATIGDTYFGPFICSLPKAMLQLAGEGRFDFLDGAIITPGCDSMRRLDECWRKAGEDISGILPKFFFHFGVPHKYADYTVKWFIEEILRLKADVERHFGVSVSDDRLREAIRLFNKSRDLLERFDGFRTAGNPAIAGTEALAVILAGTTMSRDIYVKLLEELLETLEQSRGTLKDRTRLMLVGSASDDVNLVRLIEGERAVVVADNLCFGSRFHADRVDETGDPIEALAKRYLAKNECPRMYGEYDGRLKMLIDKADRANVDGVILQNIRFCDLHGSENGLFERDLEKAGIPCLKIEREYGPLVETGRLKMRVEAFLERIGQRRQSA
ncbi:MAG TPA: 2-hydroxyacyl-CoA dehydratase family protein [Spirochaetota bacterium]|nr:2-hydroxyacyl-CoA dehydratase family protein [Spirochaetota bacterium]HPC39613.1 2-hydroxyacyl-CoA dehydratase family protein [Spirochaetota bacterium]HPL16025.1 2-hydroxyacyl-CoA dehydratase family protein [Spirochaetota bacterium]HQF09509.1 2-hydroxyacyl-CoA dehydratase family protein [Spirochaetota bacterium]HQH98192.1 2-hydroxyacyl-CoA dehydratase family protein [Spirochaetota bacterium]